MKQGGESFKGTKKGILDRFKCSECGRIYKIEWARDNHQKQCKEYNESLRRNKNNDTTRPKTKAGK